MRKWIRKKQYFQLTTEPPLHSQRDTICYWCYSIQWFISVYIFLFSFIFSCLLVLMCVFQVLNFTLMCEKKILPKVKFSRKPNVSKSLKPYNVWKIFGKRSHLEVLKPRANIYEIWTWKYKLNFKSWSQRRNFPAYWPAVIHFDLIKNGDLKLRGTFCPMRSPAYNDDWTVLRKSNQSLLNL